MSELVVPSVITGYVGQRSRFRSMVDEAFASGIQKQEELVYEYRFFVIFVRKAEKGGLCARYAVSMSRGWI